MKLRAWATLGGLGASALTVSLVKRDRHGSDTTSPARARAEMLVHQALDRELELDYSGAYDLLRSALRADPSYVGPIFEMMVIGAGVPHFLLAYFDSLAKHHPDSGVAACVGGLQTWLAGTDSMKVAPRPTSLAARDCEVYHSLGDNTGPTPVTPELQEFWRRYDDLPSFADGRRDLRRHSFGDGPALVETRLHMAPHQHPMMRAGAFSYAALHLHRLGRHAEAEEMERNARADVAWKKPGFRATYFGLTAQSHPALIGTAADKDSDSVAAHVARVVEEAIAGTIEAAEQAPDPLAFVVHMTGLGLWLLDRGRLQQAQPVWARAAVMADRIGDRNIRMFAHTRLGRTLVKLGRLAEAERELLVAREVGKDSDTPSLQKEVEHNLLHLYESLGDYEAAKRAGAAFVHFASRGSLNAVRMMSQRDLARLLRSHGDVEASRRHFERMLVDLDSLHRELNFAAEYYELTGELDRARVYYEKELGNPDGDGPRTLEGLVRIALATGDTAGAFRWAGRHDARLDARGIPESAPLLPGVLAKTGRFAEAKDALSRTRTALARRGQTTALANVTLELAELELTRGRVREARALASEAAAGARKVAVKDVALRADGIAEIAAARLGQSSRKRALDFANRSRDEVDQIGYPELRAEIRLLGAQALVASGDWRLGLARLEQAADITDSVAERIALDPVRAGYRASQRRIYDAAFETLVSHANDHDAARLFAEWSIRRKTRGLAPRETNSRITLPTVDSGTAVIDYVLSGSNAIALIVTSRGARLQRLAAHGDSVRSAIQQVYNALNVRVGSAVDVGRARFRLDVAHQLYRALLEPLIPMLQGARTLRIIPDGPLHLIPFDALVVVPNADDARSQFVLDLYEVSRAASLDRTAQRWKLGAGKVVVFAPSKLVPESVEEIAALERAVRRDRLRVLTDRLATEAAVREQSAGASIIHFAAHAVSNDEDPSRSRLVLTADGQDDGRLHVFEISSHRFEGALVFLNACETATGRVLDGAGLLSLSRSFLNSGADATVATLWPVGPNAGQFTEAFYAALDRAATPGAALIAAKRSLRKRGLKPILWAPYALFTR
ncbi:MAG: CHAT domain-containing protein [Gemmatimonadaceae bacterium]